MKYLISCISLIYYLYGFNRSFSFCYRSSLFITRAAEVSLALKREKLKSQILPGSCWFNWQTINMYHRTQFSTELIGKNIRFVFFKIYFSVVCFFLILLTFLQKMYRCLNLQAVVDVMGARFLRADWKLKFGLRPLFV